MLLKSWFSALIFGCLAGLCIMANGDTVHKANGMQRIQNLVELEGNANREFVPDSRATDIIHTTQEGLGEAIKRYLTKAQTTVHRQKRSLRQSKWLGELVPYVFQPSLGSEVVRNAVRRVMKFLTDNTCLTFVEETSRWTNGNLNWFLTQGYKLSSVINIYQGKGCSYIGNPGNGSTVSISPCVGTGINLHEIVHGIGGVHAQQDGASARYINLFYDDICSHLVGQYLGGPGNKGLGYDYASVLSYDQHLWTCTGAETFNCVRQDMCERGHMASGEETLLAELNEFYNCTGADHNGVKVDCSPGYYTRKNGVYSCVCPEEFDYKTNCKTFINQGDSSLTWHVPLSVFAAGMDNVCSDDFDKKGRFTFCGMKPSWSDPSPVPFQETGGNITFHICTKTAPTTNVDYNNVPIGGRYCFIKAVGSNCSGVLNEYVLTIGSMCPIEREGSLGDITFNGNNVTIKMCCMAMDDSTFPVDLPNTTPFRVFSHTHCPNIRGMRSYNYYVGLATTVSSEHGGPQTPYYDYGYNWANLPICYLQPAVYGCSQNVTLDAGNRKVTITTPNYPEPRPPNIRCFYCFNAAPGSQFKVTFNYFNLDRDDWFLTKQFYKWRQPYIVDNSKPPYQIVTESNYLCMHFWAGYKPGVQDQGVNFTVEVMLKEDLCYDTDTNGMDYLGDTNISETYEPCLNWKDTTDCYKSPYNKEEVITGFFEDNKCRNSEGSMLQPWCYVYKNGTNCVKRYCDVCNIKDVVDRLPTTYCTEAINQDPTFCTTAIQRYGCFKSCKMIRPPAIVPVQGHCGTPPLPSDGALIDQPKDSYKIGERLRVRCIKSKENYTSDSIGYMACTKTGWTVILTVCMGKNITRNKYTTCPKVLSEYPNFCTDSRTKIYGLKYCSESCGKHHPSPRCYATNSTTYNLTSKYPKVRAGYTMTFECNPGYFLTGGELTRVCGTKGTLLGPEPVCERSPSYLDVGMSLVRDRSSHVPENYALLLDLPMYRVPFAGKIIMWYYYCEAAEIVNFIVYRYSGMNYTFLGANTITCVPGWIMSYKVPTEDQTRVEPGDIVGVHVPKSKILSATNCQNAKNEIMTIPVNTDARELNNLTFPTMQCIVPSIAYRVAS